MIEMAYCLKCKKKTEIIGPKTVIMKNKRLATKGLCDLCGTRVMRTGAAEKLKAAVTSKTSTVSEIENLTQWLNQMLREMRKK